MNKNQKKVVKEAAGLGLTALAVAAAGTYFLYGSKNATKNRKKVKGWMLKAKGEVLQEMEHMKDMSEGRYQDTIDAMADRYKMLKNVDEKDLKNLVKELKGHWKGIQKELKAKPKAKTRRK
jgi:hypothetical protein